jgi:hypothetical protein
MKRYHQELPLMRRQQYLAHELGKEYPAGYYRKRDAHDCGKSRCGICHPDKRFSHSLTRQELAAQLRLQEQTAE